MFLETQHLVHNVSFVLEKQYCYPMIALSRALTRSKQFSEDENSLLEFIKAEMKNIKNQICKLNGIRTSDNSMMSNLPLLFANGYPTCLEKITEAQLGNFIPFMVQCSMGYSNMDRSEPEWWPDNIPFSIPLTKPNGMDNWIKKMKDIVVICYRFHESDCILTFCNKLASYKKASLGFIDNQNSWTTIYNRRSNETLVLLRNEILLYDQKQEITVGQAPFDIYLCDNCDAELFSREAIMEHEKTCNVEDGIILCVSPEPQLDDNNINENMEMCKAFLMNFNLLSKDSDNVKAEQLSARKSAANSLRTYPSIPISSPAGQQLLRTTKTKVSENYFKGRLDKLERFCKTSFPIKGGIYENRSSDCKFPCTYKKPVNNSSHVYVWPIRQFSQIRKRY